MRVGGEREGGVRVRIRVFAYSHIYMHNAYILTLQIDKIYTYIHAYIHRPPHKGFTCIFYMYRM